MKTLRIPAALGAFWAISAAFAADVTPPAEIQTLQVERLAGEVHLYWPAVTTDATGHAETVASYRVYRGTAPNFSPDKAGGTNRIASPVAPDHTDTGVWSNGVTYYYRVSAVDMAGNEGPTRPATITTLPVLSGGYTNTRINLSWTPAAPSAEVSRYRVYCGPSAGVYDRVFDAGLATTFQVTGLALYMNWYCSVAAVDNAGNEAAFSNEHIDAVAGRVRVRAQDDDLLCWLSAGAQCPPDPGELQRNDGFQLLVPATFPDPGSDSWVRVLVTWTIESRLCSPPTVPDKCGSTNPGGYNPCGDPWDRTAHLFLVLDNCVNTPGANCITPQNLELMRVITPFGTDAPPPSGTGVVPPRVLTFDVTPYTPLLTGTRYVGTDIVHFVQAGWHVTVEFEFSKRPDEVSLKPPADGIQIVGFGGAPLPVHPVTIPPAATQVMARVFTSGHGGSLYCDGGSNNGGTCTGSAQCPGGTCQACDEFCHRENRILVNGAPVWTWIPFRTDCSPPGNTCRNWNACGFPSCTFSRAGWCPGYIACHKNPPCDQDINLTTFLPPGSTSDLSYDVLVQRGYWPISLVIYWYE